MTNNQPPDRIEARSIEQDEWLQRHGKALDSMVDKIEKLMADVDQAQREADTWKANHDNQVALRRLLTVRNDLPPDRVALAEQINRLEAERDQARDDCMRGIAAVDLRAERLIDAANAKADKAARDMNAAQKHAHVMEAQHQLLERRCIIILKAHGIDPLSLAVDR